MSALQPGVWRGYLLLSPTLLFVFGILAVPLFALIVVSTWTQVNFDLVRSFTLSNYSEILSLKVLNGWILALHNPLYLKLIVRSIWISFMATTTAVLVAYPMAYFLAFGVVRYKLLWLLLITIPLWTSYLLRVFSWKVILGFNGVINLGLIAVGLVDKPLDFLLFNRVAVIITLAHAWAAFAVLPIYVSLEKIDRSLLEAATDLGDSGLARFFGVTLPLSMPGVVSAALLVFIPTVGDYVTPALVGGTEGLMIGNIIQILFGKANNAPLGAAISFVTMLITALVVSAFLWLTGHNRMRRQGQ